jgi:hydroxymethylbilane synthase
MKDLPMDIPEEFKLIAISKREDARDAFISNEYGSLKDMPKGAVVGTSSLRRQSQIKSKYPHLTIEPLRGNLQTRLKKLDEGQYGGIILAAAGLIRLDLKKRIKRIYQPFG